MTAIIAIIVVTALLLVGILVVYAVGVREIERREREAMAELGLAYDWDNLSDEELDELEEQGIIEWVSAEGGRSTTTGGGVGVMERPKAGLSQNAGYTKVYTTDNSPQKGTDEPVFRIGEMVVTVNPFTHEFVYMDYDGTPLYYEIKNFKYDEKGHTFRYLLSGEETWVAEDWIKRTNVAMMVEETEVTERYLGKGKPTTADIAEDYLRKHTIDTYLDMMNDEDPAVREQGKTLLTAYQQRIAESGVEMNA